ncbi:MAG: MopE-related protein [Polyangiales bacterium]
MNRTTILLCLALPLVSACSALSGGEVLVGDSFGDGSVRADGALTADSGRRPDGAAVTDASVALDVAALQGDSAVGGSDAAVSGDGSVGKDGGAPEGCGAREICGNGLDDDCNDQVDEGCACLPGETQRCYPGDPAQAGRGVCVWGTSRCEGQGEFGTWSACAGAGSPQPVVCGMGMDFRCNGMVDEGCLCAPGETRPCYTGPMGTVNVGACRGGTQTCDPTGRSWGTCVGEVLPAAERCDGSDADCDGMRNEGCVCTLGANRVCYGGPSGTPGVGICRSGVQPCVRTADGSATMWSTACAGEVRPAPAEVCGNGLDDNCNGMVDEGCVMTCPDGRPRCGGVCCAAGSACAANICVGNGQLRFTLTWDVQADLDLHVVPPCGTEIYYGRLNACGGSLDRDSCPALAATDSADRCNGPENVFWASAPPAGAYLLCVNPWQMRSGTTARWTLQAYRGTTLVQTWTGTRSASASYVACSRSAPSFVAAFTP